VRSRMSTGVAVVRGLGAEEQAVKVIIEARIAKVEARNTLLICILHAKTGSCSSVRHCTLKSGGTIQVKSGEKTADAHVA